MRTPRRRRPDSGAPRTDDAGPVLRALGASVYAPTAIFAIGQGAIQPVLVLAAIKVGMSRPAAASVMGLLGLVGVVSAPLAGMVVARAGGRRSMVLGTVLAVGAASGIVAAVSVPSAVAVGVFVAAVVLQGIAGNLWGLARQGYVADAVPVWARARALSFLGGMMRLGVLVGPAIGSAVIVVAGLRGPFVLQAAMALAALWLVLAKALPTAQLHEARALAEAERLAIRQEPGAAPGPGTDGGGAADAAPAPDPVTAPEDATTGAPGDVAAPAPATRTTPERTRTAVDLRATAVVAVAMTCLQLLRTNRNVLVPLWGTHLGMSEALISATFAAGALLDVAMFLPSGRWMDRYGRLAGILPSLLIMGASVVVTVVWTTPVGFVVGTCLMGFGNGFGSGIVMTMGADLAPVPGRERFLGWWQGIGNVGAAAGPFIVSVLTATVGLTAGMWATAALGLVAGTWAWIAMPRAYAHAGIDMRGRSLPWPDASRARRLTSE